MTTPDAQDRRSAAPPPVTVERSSSQQRGVLAPLAAVLVGVVVTLFAQFAMDSVADSSDLGHWVQHGLLFWSGILVGLGLFRLYQRAGERR